MDRKALLGELVDSVALAAKLRASRTIDVPMFPVPERPTDLLDVTSLSLITTDPGTPVNYSFLSLQLIRSTSNCRG